MSLSLSLGTHIHVYRAFGYPFIFECTGPPIRRKGSASQHTGASTAFPRFITPLLASLDACPCLYLRRSRGHPQQIRDISVFGVTTTTSYVHPLRFVFCARPLQLSCIWRLQVRGPEPVSSTSQRQALPKLPVPVCAFVRVRARKKLELKLCTCTCTRNLTVAAPAVTAVGKIFAHASFHTEKQPQCLSRQQAPQ